MLEITDRSLQPISVCLRLLIYRSFKNFKNTFCTFVLLFWNVGTILHNLFVPYRNNCSPGTTPSPRCDLKIRLQSLYLIRFSLNTFTVPLFNPFLFKYVFTPLYLIRFSLNTFTPLYLIRFSLNTFTPLYLIRFSLKTSTVPLFNPFLFKTNICPSETSLTWSLISSSSLLNSSLSSVLSSSPNQAHLLASWDQIQKFRPFYTVGLFLPYIRCEFASRAS